MESVSHRAPSVGSITKKLLAAHPGLGAADLIEIIRASLRAHAPDGDQFSVFETVDEEHALALADSMFKRN